MPTTPITYPIIAPDGSIRFVTENVDVSVVNGPTLLAKATAALSNNAAFLGIASPTTAQTVAQTQALTRQIDALIRLVMGQLDTIANT